MPWLCAGSLSWNIVEQKSCLRLLLWFPCYWRHWERSLTHYTTQSPKKQIYNNIWWSTTFDEVRETCDLYRFSHSVSTSLPIMQIGHNATWRHTETMKLHNGVFAQLHLWNSFLRINLWRNEETTWRTTLLVHYILSITNLKFKTSKSPLCSELLVGAADNTNYPY